MRILFNDEGLIAVDKPPHVLSVPGRLHRVDGHFTPRNVQWTNAILELAARYDRDEDHSSPLVFAAAKLIKGKHTVPRQKSKFVRYLERVAKLSDKAVVEKVWRDLDELDQSLNRFDSQSLPTELYSAADFAGNVTKSKVFHVHRLDQETSGALLFAKASEIASELSLQFRDRQVYHGFIYRWYGI
jgi:23S rRNA-/tRNA-specific pseudouridylate synthase